MMKPGARLAVYLAIFVPLGFLAFVVLMGLQLPVLLLAHSLLTGGWREPCDRDPRAEYLAGRVCRNLRGSPFNTGNVNKLLENGSCPLQFASLYGELEFVEELLGKGADPARCAGFPDDFFLIGDRCARHPEAARRLLDVYGRAGIRHSRPQALLFLAAERSCIPAIELALSMGAEVNAVNANGSTALGYTTNGVSDEKIAATATLIRHGANPLQPVGGGETLYENRQRLLGSAGNWPKMQAALLDKPAK